MGNNPNLPKMQN